MFFLIIKIEDIQIKKFMPLIRNSSVKYFSWSSDWEKKRRKLSSTCNNYVTSKKCLINITDAVSNIEWEGDCQKWKYQTLKITNTRQYLWRQTVLSRAAPVASLRTWHGDKHVLSYFLIFAIFEIVPEWIRVHPNVLALRPYLTSC